MWIHVGETNGEMNVSLTDTNATIAHTNEYKI